MARTYRSKAAAAVHETMQDMYKAGLASKQTMKEFDELCLTPVKQFSPKQIRALRVREDASQAVFAIYLNVTAGLISQWERGEKKPRGASLKLLTLVEKYGLREMA